MQKLPLFPITPEGTATIIAMISIESIEPGGRRS
jgi:hypothetical protein